MSKQAKESNCGTELPTKVVSTSLLTRLALAGMATIGCLYLSPAAEAQQAYYLPQAASAPVTVNYGALTPYGAPNPAVPGGFQPYGYTTTPSARLSAAPKSVFTPYGQPAYGQVAPAYAAQPVYGYASVPTVTPFVAPYANPAFAPGLRAGLPISTPASNGNPQSYLNVPGAQKVADAKPTKKKRKKKAAAAPAPTSTPTATEEGAAAQVAAAEAVLESTPAAAPAAPAATSEAVSEAAPVAAAEPVPAPTPPAEPDTVPASVPSPAASAPASAVAAAEPAAEATSEAAAPAAEATSEATSSAEAPAEQVASAEAPADTNAATGAPAGGARIVFDTGSDDLPQGATADLDALAQKMSDDTNLKVQVLAYSSGTPDAESQARRKALARGLEVRKYLIGKGVRSNRIDVRALGTKSEGGPADRVDIVPSAG